MKSIDKAAFIAAGVLIVLLCALPFVMGGGSGGKAAEIEGYVTKIGQLTDDQSLKTQKPPEKWLAIVQENFDAQHSSKLEGWPWYMRPAKLETQKDSIKKAATHEAPMLCLLSFKRDDTSGMHEISVRVGECDNIKDHSILLEVRDSEDQEWKTVGSKAMPVGDVSFQQKDGLVKGRSYVYRVTSTATSATNVDFTPEQAKLVSAESEALLFCVDETWYAGTIQGKSYSGGKLVPGKVSVKHRYWDYEKGEIVEESQFMVESEPGKWKDSKPFKGTEIRLQRIKKIEGKWAAVLREPEGRTKDAITLIAGGKPLPLTTDDWINPDCASKGEGDEAGEGESSSESNSTKEEDKPAEEEDDEDNPFGE